MSELHFSTPPRAGYITNTIETQYTQALAYTGSNVEYVGLAAPGTSKAAALWQIKKLTYSGDNVTDVQFADASTSFNKVWNDRASYTYS